MSWETHEAAKKIADGWHSELEETRERNAVLGRENAKLRELCMDMWDFFCVVPDEPHAFKEELDFTVEVWRRMRELGVEVDDG